MPPRTPLAGYGRVMQGFTFDDVNRRLFVVQLADATDGDDLLVSQLDLDGRLLGSMRLADAGHGVSIGVEPVGDASYLWTEAAASDPAKEGRGTALQRFRFVDGERPADVRTFLRGSRGITCATDPVLRRLSVRRGAPGGSRYDVYDLAAAARGDFSRPLFPPVQPEVDGVFQGYAVHGSFLYLLTGEGHADPDELDSRISCIDLRTGRAVQRDVLQDVGRELPFREPEGMAVTRGPDGRVRLCFGFAPRDSYRGRLRFANVYAKDRLVDAPD